MTQEHDSRSLIAQPQFFFRAEHTLGENALEVGLPDLLTAGEQGSFPGQGNPFSRLQVGSSADDGIISLPVICCTDGKMITLGKGFERVQSGHHHVLEFGLPFAQVFYFQP